MKKGTITGIVIAALLVFLFAGGCSSYNGMVDADQAVEKQWGNVQNQYQRRADLIPNLVSTVKGYSEHEANTLESVTRARAGLTEAYNAAQTASAETKGAAPENLQQFQQAQEKLQSALGIYVNAVRGISRPESQPELPRPPGTARRYREPHLHRAHTLQRGCGDLQQESAPFPRTPFRLDFQFRRETDVRGRSVGAECPEG